MAYVTYVERDDAPEELRASYDLVAKKLGVMIHFYKAMAHSPDLLTGFLALNRSQAKSSLAPKLRELAFLRASAINGCDYCVHYHSRAAKLAGLSYEQVADIAKPDAEGEFTDLERDVIRFADAVTRDLRANDALMSRLKASLDDRQLVELTATVALANFTNRVNVALAIDLP